MFVILSFAFWPMVCLFVLDLVKLLITMLVSSIKSKYDTILHCIDNQMTKKTHSAWSQRQTAVDCSFMTVSFVVLFGVIGRLLECPLSSRL